MGHKERLEKLGIWGDFVEAYESGNKPVEDNLEYGLIVDKNRTLVFIINTYFVWRSTPQGFGYWYGVVKGLK